MSETILITGVNGFVGHHLVRELTSMNIPVAGIGHDNAPASGLSSMLAEYIGVDLTDKAVVEAIDLGKYRAVIHLAGLANVGQSFAEPAHFLAANTAMSINLLQHALDTKATA